MEARMPARDKEKSSYLRSFSSLREFQSGTRNDSVAAINAILEETETRSDLNAYITKTPEIALSQAEASDDRIARNRPRKLEGVPISVKDNYCTKGIRTTAGSKILSNFVPTYESFVSRKLLDAGCVYLGKTNMDEFGMGSSTENSFFGATLNPRGLELGRNNVVPGGSSGGAAAAVAAHLCLGALATDTGGSIRQPAAFCGVVGMKPTYGLCSRSGIIAYASSLDQAGAIARTVEDTAILIDTIVGEDENDTTSATQKIPNIEAFLKEPARRYKIGIPTEFRDLSINSDLETVWHVTEAVLKDAGFDIQYIDLASLKHSLPAYYIIALSEASSNLARYDGVRYGHRSMRASNITELYENTRAEGFKWETKKRIIMGTYGLSAGYYDAYYEKACKVRRVISNEFDVAFRSVDCLMWPTTPTTAFEFGSHSLNPVSMYLEDVFTVPVNLAGLPAISVPISIGSSFLPMGIQVIGPRFGDADVFRVAKAIEDRVGKVGLTSVTGAKPSLARNKHH
jgi:aspartyl-tRNA(Asn)/glutamyl-tRNA(Gln) amidotransferase subunit A